MQANLAEPSSNTFSTGVLLVNGTTLIAEGHTREPHAPHQHAAECAIAKAKRSKQSFLLQSATMYTTMEPCSSTRMSKVPCTTHIIKAKIGRVVIGVKEPESFVNCKGVETLCAAGIDVVHLKILQEECLATNIHLLT
ncbi:hypothetical protein GGI09_009098 [Coemansia sp. S100]|nr:hypothetical protein GGI09_009098 [Coemansia sp. S100]KAJ2073035.1 hypothetical protein GGI16_008913 [Coemansia sp. S142-1]KAJ2074019.1 hypothetical protein GGH13_001605 [Coemansia sp. S155-1]KAJ2326193.1 hypothetical protein GGH92_010294 [Coemansia sp. RSA 2673]